MRVLCFRILKTGDEEIRVEDIGDPNVDLRRIQEIVGGYIRALYFDDFCALVNEDGAPLNLPINVSASLFLATEGWRRKYLVGSLALVGRADEETFGDVPERIIESASTLHPDQFKGEN